MRHLILASAALLLFAGCTPPRAAVELDEWMPCTGLDAWLPEFDPEEAYGSAVACANAGDYRRAAELAILGETYVHFDMLRIPDRTAHRAGDELLKATQKKLKPSRLAELRATVNGIQVAPDQRRLLCKQIQAVGMPKYEPDYMAKFGMGWADGADQVKLTGKAAEAAWHRQMTREPICAI